MSDAAERTVVLQPCATVRGRVADADGKPVTGGIRIRLLNEGDLGRPDVDSPNSTFPPKTSMRTAGSGSTTWPRAVDISSRRRTGRFLHFNMEPETFKAFELARNLKAEPGQIVDLGTFNATAGQLIKEPERPQSPKSEQGKAATRTMPITGRIVDLEGRPVAGATVQVTQITKPKGDDLIPGSRRSSGASHLDRLQASDLRTADHARGEAADRHDRLPRADSASTALERRASSSSRRSKARPSVIRRWMSSRDGSEPILAQGIPVEPWFGGSDESTEPISPTPPLPDGPSKASCAMPRPTNRWPVWNW